MRFFGKKFESLINNQFATLFLLFLIFFIWRLVLLKMDYFPFNSDEAIVGLMGKHIIDGERPLFFYGQSYMGSLDAYFVALSFLIFGEKVIAIRIVQIVLFFLTIVNLYFYVIIAFQNRIAAFLSSILLIFAPVNLILYTTVSLGGYVEALYIGSSVLLISALLYRKADIKSLDKKDFLLLMFAGFLTGLGLWVNPISLTIGIPAIVVTLFRIFFNKVRPQLFLRIILMLLIGFLIGSFFWWYTFILNKDIRFLTEIFGSAVSVDNGNYFQITLQHIATFFLFAPTVILGLRPPWDTVLIGKYFIPFVLIFWILILALFLSKRKTYTTQERISFLILTGIMVLDFIGYVFTSFGNDPSGRYFLPYFIPLSIGAGFLLSKFPRKKFIYILFLFVISYNIYGVMSLAKVFPFLTTQFYPPAQVDHTYIGELVSFLENNDEYIGFSNYWVSYPLAFKTNEEIIAIPLLPYHLDLQYTGRDNRIPSYTEVLNGENKFFYITTNNPKLDEVLVTNLSLKSIKFKYKEIGDYHIFYNLSLPIYPQDLGIYENYK
ncbi:MAG: hypothetical protein CVU46_16225 [Chloroflexi bacterium HGW-Chloroflexi-8]|nr:MAG: hypothetical protein CVU46_16225 [Chloroflexi bacterium HGW-Chloroflexi-8]